jgi:hypothetical protein
MGQQLVVCGTPVPVTLNGEFFAVCTKPPNHKGRHGCMVDFEWPNEEIIVGHSDPVEHKKIQENPPELMTFRIRAPKGESQRPYIQAELSKHESRGVPEG